MGGGGCGREGGGVGKKPELNRGWCGGNECGDGGMIWPESVGGMRAGGAKRWELSGIGSCGGGAEKRASGCEEYAGAMCRGG